MADPRGFIKFAREAPTRRPVAVRVYDWQEVYQPFPITSITKQGICVTLYWRAS